MLDNLLKHKKYPTVHQKRKKKKRRYRLHGNLNTKLAYKLFVAISHRYSCACSSKTLDRKRKIREIIA
jgi:hypothetical protein